jgi:hypothetical protein
MDFALVVYGKTSNIIATHTYCRPKKLMLYLETDMLKGAMNA